VQHRPDIRAAQANLNSASALIGVATANRLPLVSLTAQTGSSAANLANLFVPATAFYALGGNVTQTIFDAGTLLHRQKQAEAEFDQAYAQYRSTVIGAFQNVADALRAIEADARAEKAAKTAETAAAKSLAVVRKQLEYGQISTIALLNAQQTYMQAMLALVQEKAGRYSDTAALFQALGGGWWNRPPPAGETW
jgi:outer membrane protein TolC